VTRAALDQRSNVPMYLIGADGAAGWFTLCGYEARAK
jgi:hypothetical protein